MPVLTLQRVTLETLFLASTSAQINNRDNAGTMAGFL
jgi:hypothetical protein